MAMKDLRILNCPWGLELSLCTGIARRVTLRSLLYGEVLRYLALSLPGEWNNIALLMTSLAEMTSDEFEKMLEGEVLKNTKKRETLCKAVELFILAMESTGVQNDGHTLVLWWPERGVPAPRGLHITKAQYSGKNPWIPMIKDGEHCAVFGLATSRCLQHDDIKTCR